MIAPRRSPGFSGAQLANVIAPIRTEPGGPAWRQTIFWPFADFANLGHGTVLRTQIDSPTYSRESASERPSFSYYASLPLPVRNTPGMPEHTVEAPPELGFSRGELDRAIRSVEEQTDPWPVEELEAATGPLDVVFVESGGDNLAATFSPDLADLTLYVVSVCQGEKIPRKGGPAITRSDLLIINKADLAPHVGADLGVMESDARRQRGERPYVFTDLTRLQGVDEVIAFIARAGGLPLPRAA